MSGQKLKEDQIKFEKERLSTGRLAKTNTSGFKVIVETPEMSKKETPSNKMAALEMQNKHHKNNPLKDISNQIQNSANQHERSQYSMFNYEKKQ